MIYGLLGCNNASETHELRLFKCSRNVCITMGSRGWRRLVDIQFQSSSHSFEKNSNRGDTWSYRTLVFLGILRLTFFMIFFRLFRLLLRVSRDLYLLSSSLLVMDRIKTFHKDLLLLLLLQSNTLAWAKRTFTTTFSLHPLNFFFCFSFSLTKS